MAQQLLQQRKSVLEARARGRVEARFAREDDAPGDGPKIYPAKSHGFDGYPRDAEAGPRAGKYGCQRRATVTRSTKAGTPPPPLGPQTCRVVGLGGRPPGAR